MAGMHKVIQLGSSTRDRRSISLKTPLLSLVVISDAQFVADMDALESYLADELNVRERDKNITVGGIRFDEDDLTIARVLVQ
ncbi:hypothetical protein MCOR07_005872 [Pyricularia oryzae]|nr:hypothetical protein MCOR19_007125 [Pyricularia oryzae]KAI6305488.1 hypothetical protein MCOR29_010447 [Pyricularia oryzae]KAI6344625.1 hypothetical protein MCOR28_004022 [Pyricularia oryzae]KAI6392597.1 hypothetical protein MCOR23_008406 [Pyricularia oryzae]KAI6419836.1 hypothetical protein MCOR21_010078 [Pyricularia oryzae]